MQLDSHMRLELGWDISVIEMLHNCDAGEYSVISTYPTLFINSDPTDGNSAIMVDDRIHAMRWEKF